MCWYVLYQWIPMPIADVFILWWCWYVILKWILDYVFFSPFFFSPLIPPGFTGCWTKEQFKLSKALGPCWHTLSNHRNKSFASWLYIADWRHCVTYVLDFCQCTVFWLQTVKLKWQSIVMCVGSLLVILWIINM